MKGLYKGKYLIAIYDENDNLIDVGCNPKELLTFSSENPYSLFMRALKRRKNRVYLIDVTEKQEDIFAEEDEVFLDFVKETHKTAKQRAKELGMNYGSFIIKRSMIKNANNICCER
jgi:hypothetical protein